MTDVTALLSEPLTTTAEAVAWIHAMHREGYGTHPDDSGASIVDPGGEPLFTPDDAALFDARWAEVFALVPDPYLVALEAVNRNRFADSLYVTRLLTALDLHGVPGSSVEGLGGNCSGIVVPTADDGTEVIVSDGDGGVPVEGGPVVIQWTDGDTEHVARLTHRNDPADAIRSTACTAAELAGYGSEAARARETFRTPEKAAAVIVYVAEAVDKAPPLSEGQINDLRRILRPTLSPLPKRDGQ